MDVPAQRRSPVSLRGQWSAVVGEHVGEGDDEVRVGPVLEAAEAHRTGGLEKRQLGRAGTRAVSKTKSR
jgi:hypothetical protein